MLPITSDGFKGHVSPATVWAALKVNQAACLVDVRTQAEWAFVGTADDSEAKGKILFIEWQRFPDMSANAQFAEEVAGAIADQDTPVFLLCRSGTRSQDAARALTQAGFGHCYNVAGGFEGDADAHHRRGFVNGWKVEGCPWRQS